MVFNLKKKKKKKCTDGIILPYITRVVYVLNLGVMSISVSVPLGKHDT